MNTATQSATPTREDFVKIAQKVGYELVEFHEFVSGRQMQIQAGMIPPCTEEMKACGVTPIITLCARRIKNKWQLWSTSSLHGLEVIGKISPKRSLIYRYIIAFPT